MIKIPKGWRKLRKGELIKEGDKFSFIDFAYCISSVGERYGRDNQFLKNNPDSVVIRPKQHYDIKRTQIPPAGR